MKSILTMISEEIIRRSTVCLIVDRRELMVLRGRCAVLSPALNVISVCINDEDSVMSCVSPLALQLEHTTC